MTPEEMTPEEVEGFKEMAREYESVLKDKWAKSALERQNQQLIYSDGPKKWAELRQRMKDAVDLINRESSPPTISWDDSHSDRIEMTRIEDGRKFEGGFDSVAKVAFFYCRPAQINLKLHFFVDAGQLEFVVWDQEARATYINKLHDLAYLLLRYFLFK